MAEQDAEWVEELGAERAESARLPWCEAFVADRPGRAVRDGPPVSPRPQGPAAGSRAPDPRRLEEVADLGCRLLGDEWDGSRAVLVARLEATAEGCRWLLGQWAELQTLQSSGTPGEEADLHRFIHLLGKQRFEAVTDPVLNALIVAWDVLKPGIAPEFWEWTCQDERPTHPAMCNRKAGAS